MYRRPKFLEVLLTIRQEMAREADYDVDLFTEMIRTSWRHHSAEPHEYSLVDVEEDDSRKRPNEAKHRRRKNEQ